MGSNILRYLPAPGYFSHKSCKKDKVAQQGHEQQQPPQPPQQIQQQQHYFCPFDMGLGRDRNSEKLPRVLILIFAVLGRTMQDGRGRNLQFSFFFPKVFMFGDSLIQVIRNLFDCCAVD